MYPKVKLRQEHGKDEYEGGAGDVRDLGLKAFLSLSFHSPTSSVKDHKVVSVPSIVKVPKCFLPHISIPRVSVTEDLGDCSLTSDSSGSAEPEKDGDTDESKVYIRADLIPRVPVTEDFGEGGLTSDSSGSAEPEKNGDTDESKVYIRVDLIPRVPVTKDFGDGGLASDLSGHGGLEKDHGPEKDGNIDDENKVNIRASPIPRPRAVISSPENDLMIGSRNKTGNGRVYVSKNSTVLPNRHALAQCKVKSHDTTDIPRDARKSTEPKSKDRVDHVGKKKVHKGSVKSDNLHRHWKF